MIKVGDVVKLRNEGQVWYSDTVLGDGATGVVKAVFSEGVHRTRPSYHVVFFKHPTGIYHIEERWLEIVK